MLTKSDLDYLRSYFSIPQDETNLDAALCRRGLCQADVVLALLKDARRDAVAAVVGRPIQVLPPDPRIWMVPAPVVVHSRRTGDARRVVKVSRNPRLPTTGAFQRFRLIRPGLTIAQLLARGVTRRDIRQGVRRKYIRLSR